MLHQEAPRAKVDIFYRTLGKWMKDPKIRIKRIEVFDPDGRTAEVFETEDQQAFRAKLNELSAWGYTNGH